MTTLHLSADGPFSLAASARFLAGWRPGAVEPGAADLPLRIAFPVEGDWRTVGVTLRSSPGGALAEVVGDVPASLVEAQLRRVLSLDVDGSGFPAVGERDPVVGELQRRFPGLRPVCFWSAYEAAAWALISHRVRIVQAAAVKRRMAEALGDTVVVDGELVAGFPAPARLLSVAGFPALSGRKPEYLRAAAQAALDGVLDSTRLRALPPDEALAELRRLPGIGPFSAQLVLLRGAGSPDTLATEEPRLRRAVGAAYGLGGEVAPARLAEIAEGWRPYRTWVALLLRTWLESETGEIASGRQEVLPQPVVAAG